MEKKNKVSENETVSFPDTPHKIETSDGTSDKNNIPETPAEIKENEDVNEDVQVGSAEKKVEPVVPDIPDIPDIPNSLGGRELEKWEAEILKTLVLVKAGWDVDRIAKEFYRYSKVWVRKSGMVLLAL